MRNTKGQFVKGYGFWTGKKRPGFKSSKQFKKGEHSSLKTEFKKGQTKGELNNKWKGDSVGYFGLHTWISRNLTKSSQCQFCAWNGKTHWANVSKKYKRELNDWLELCAVCHRNFDGFVKINKAQAIEVRKRYGEGESQRSIAKDYGVTQMTISRLVRNLTKYHA